MQTSLARRSARRRNGGRRRGGGAARSVAVALPLFLLVAFLAVAATAFVGAVSAYAFYSRNLPEATNLEKIAFNQQSVIWDRTGTIELARFGDQRREVATFDQLSPVILDATTAVEDKSFWTNTGFDPVGIASAAIATLRGDPRGGSTITQQLVRQRLLDDALVQDPARTVERKIKEIIQSVRVTQAYPGLEGKQRIITAYLNQNFYGNNDYGIRAAARDYFGVADLKDLTLAQAAILAAIPKSPTSYDLIRNAVTQDDGTLLVPDTTDIVKRRNLVLNLMEDNKTPISDQHGIVFSAADYDAARVTPVILAPRVVPYWRAPHFVWQVREQLTALLCDPGAQTCPALERGGLKVITTLDLRLQALGERWVKAAVILPHAKDPRAYGKQIGVTYQPWMAKLRDKDVRNGALIAMDYQTGEILAYVGSADYYAAQATKQFQPQFDVLAHGWRQPGSAFKPFNYVTGIDDRTITAATVLMDVTTNFAASGTPYVPTDYDNLERGPVRVRRALQLSLNIPSIKTLAYNGIDHVFETAKKMGLRFQRERTDAGLSMAIGTVETHPVDLVTGFATLANGGRYLGHTAILRVLDAGGKDLISPYRPPAGTQVVSPQAAYIVTDMLKGNTDPAINPYWGAFAIKDKHGVRRPTAMKTGTNNDAKDLNAYGYVAPPSDAGRQLGQYALVVGAWAGNSDNTVVSTRLHPVFSLDVAGPIWQGFLLQATRDWTIREFVRPTGITEATVDAYSGMAPGAFTTTTVKELFIEGTEPRNPDNTKIALQVEAETGRLWADGCSGTRVTRGFLDLSRIESAFPLWQKANFGWIARARRGVGISGGPKGTRTTYFYNFSYHPYGSTWGAPFPPRSTCVPAPSPSPSPSPGGSPLPTDTPGPVHTPKPPKPPP